MPSHPPTPSAKTAVPGRHAEAYASEATLRMRVLRRRSNDAGGLLFSVLLGFCGEMGKEPIADRSGHLVKILPPSELVIGAWQEIQPLWTSQRIT